MRLPLLLAKSFALLFVRQRTEVLLKQEESLCLHLTKKVQIMKIKLATSCFVIATLLSPLMAHAEDRDADRSHPITYVKDSAITAKVKAMLADEKMSSLKHIKVDTDAKGVVVLSGKVKTQEQADKAVSIAQAVEGVTSVTSHIQIKKDD